MELWLQLFVLKITNHKSSHRTFSTNAENPISSSEIPPPKKTLQLTRKRVVESKIHSNVSNLEEEGAKFSYRWISWWWKGTPCITQTWKE